MRDDPVSGSGQDDASADRKATTVIRGKSLGLGLLALTVLLAVSGTARSEQAAHPGKQGKPSSKEAVKADEPVLEAKAIEILKASSSRLAAAHSMTFTAVTSYESPSRLGPPLIYTTKSDVTLQRPDKLRVITLGDGPASEFYYDGKTMLAFSPAENFVAVADAPPTIDAALKAAYDSAAIYFPFTDLVVADPYEGMADGLKHAFYIGQSKVIGGTTTDMVAIANNWVFEQIWIGTEDKLPRMAWAVFHADRQHLRHQVEFSNWQLDPAVAADAFASSSAAAANHIPFARPDLPALPPGVKPRTNAKPSKSK
jgi:hypothetical protein